MQDGRAIPRRMPADSVRDFSVLEHTADVGFEAFGATPGEVFRNAGRALMNFVIDLSSVESRARVPVAVRAHDPAGLMVNWLSEIVYLYDAEGWLFRDFEIDGVTDCSAADPKECSIVAAGIGERFEPGRHRIKLLVKAITYHQLALEQNCEGRWRARVYVDI
jgi:SHS2 domain-containing protein